MSSWEYNDRIHLGIEDFEIIGDRFFKIGVPKNYPRDFKMRAFAGAKSYMMRLSSIDYTLKTYGDYWNFGTTKDTYSDFVFEVTDKAKDEVISVLQYLSSTIKIPDIPNVFACSAAIFRLQNTFRAALFAIRNDLHFESASLERMILEQLSWILSVRQNNSKLPADFFNIEPMKCITKLKQLFPNAGKLYGELSESSHIMPQTTLRYISFYDGKIDGITLSTRPYSAIDAYNLLLLSDMLAVISEYVYVDQISKYKYLATNSDGLFKPNPKRPGLKLINKYKKGLNKILIKNGPNS